jgi:hypothetical protein
MRKGSFVTCGACVLVTLLLFVTPSLRQALHLSLSLWRFVLQANPYIVQTRLHNLVNEAEVRHDGEALAFAAIRCEDEYESVVLSDEAVRLDPTLLWVYAIVAERHPGLGQVSEWISKLDQWDPDNAFIHLIEAESIDISYIVSGAASKSSHEKEKDRKWQTAMSAAFGARKFDDYSDRIEELDRRIVSRYRFCEPYIVLGGETHDMPSYAYWDSRRFADSLLQSAVDLEARGDRSGAIEKYLMIAHYGQMLDPLGNANSQRSMISNLQAGAFRRLQILYENEGQRQQSALFGYLARKFEMMMQEQQKELRRLPLERDFHNWLTILIRTSGLMVLGFGTLTVICGLAFLTRNHRLNFTSSPPDPLLVRLSLGSSIGLMVSLLTLYATQRPYLFLSQSGMLDNVPAIFDCKSYFWTTVIVICGPISLFMLLRGFLSHRSGGAHLD